MTPLTIDQISAFTAQIPTAKQDEPMSTHTYLKIGGPARLYFVANKIDALIEAVNAALSLNIPFAVIGGGSNLLVSDDGYEGVIIQAADTGFIIDGEKVTINAGAFTAMVARATADAGLTGFEWGVGVPGTIGGAVFGNAGCFGGEMKDAVESVDTLRLSDGQNVTYSNAECGFAYRESNFKHQPHVILSTTLKLKAGDIASAKAKIADIMSKRKDTQPQGAFTAGCLFKNFDFKDESVLEKLKREDEVLPEFLASKRIPAGWLIDKLGLKGTTIGKAQVSPIHGNFLVNLGGARAQDVLQLSSLVKMKVRDCLLYTSDAADE